MEQANTAKDAFKEATAPSESITPTIDEIVNEYLEDQTATLKGWANVFDECIRPDGVTVETEAQASSIARMMTRAESELEDVKATAVAMIRKAETRISGLEFLFKMPLQIWTTAKLIGKKTRSLVLEGGKLALRKVPKSTRFVDAAATLAWAQAELPEAVEMVPKLKLDAVLAWEEANGKAAPGRELTPEHDSFKVSIPK